MQRLMQLARHASYLKLRNLTQLFLILREMAHQRIEDEALESECLDEGFPGDRMGQCGLNVWLTCLLN